MTAGLLLSLALAPQLQQIREPLRLDPGSTAAAENLAADQRDGAAAVAWVEAAGGVERLMCATASTLGHDWSPPLRIDSGAGADLRISPGAVAFFDGGLIACWLDRRSGAEDLYLRVSRDRGATWEPEIRVDDGGAPGAAQVRAFALVAGAGGSLHLAMAIYGASGGEARCASSHDGGASFAPSIPLGPAGGVVRGVDAALSAGVLHVAWLRDPAFPFASDVLYQRSGDGGATWLGSPVPLDGGLPAAGDDLDLAAAGARVAAVWETASAVGALRANFSADGGLTWLPVPPTVGGSVNSGARPSFARLFFAGNRALAAWTDDRVTTGIHQPYLAETTDFGASWSEAQLFPTYGLEPRFAGDGARRQFAVVWNGQAQIYATVSRAASPEPQPVFVVRAAPTSSIRDATPAYDPLYEDILVAWLEQEPGGAHHPWVGGFRIAQILPRGNFIPGGTVWFEAAQFAHDRAGGTFRVLIAGARGAAALPAGDGRLLGLAADPWLAASASAPALRGVLDASGAGATPPIPLPPAVTPGARLWFAAVSSTGLPPAFGTITAARVVTVF